MGAGGDRSRERGVIESPTTAGRLPSMIPATTCIFCRIVAGEADASLVYRDDLVTAFMDAHPVAQGHLLVVPNHHVAGLDELSDDAAGRMMVVGRRLAGALRRSGIPCDGVNLLLADGTTAGQTVFHCHLHVLPRTSRDGFGFRRPLGAGLPAGRQALESVAKQIRVVLDAGV
jgi:histidine triad (HIT) family protein